MLAKNVNGDVGILNARGALGFFASKLAPTGGGGGGQLVRPLARSQASQLPQLTALLGQCAIPVGAGLAVFDLVSIGKCAYEARNGR